MLLPRQRLRRYLHFCAIAGQRGGGAKAQLGFAPLAPGGPAGVVKLARARPAAAAALGAAPAHRACDGVLAGAEGVAVVEAAARHGERVRAVALVAAPQPWEGGRGRGGAEDGAGWWWWLGNGRGGLWWRDCDGRAGCRGDVEMALAWKEGGGGGGGGNG